MKKIQYIINSLCYKFVVIFKASSPHKQLSNMFWEFRRSLLEWILNRISSWSSRVALKTSLDPWFQVLQLLVVYRMSKTRVSLTDMVDNNGLLVIRFWEKQSKDERFERHEWLPWIHKSYQLVPGKAVLLLQLQTVRSYQPYHETTE